MRRLWVLLACLGTSLCVADVVFAQSPKSEVSGQSSPSAAAASVPRVIRINGTLRPADGLPLAQVEILTLRIYADENDDTVLWEETQHVMPDADGRYTVLLGSTQADGLPVDVFRSGEARWVGTTLERAGEREGPRIRLVSVPYALRASDADTLGGHPVSAFLLSKDKSGDVTASADASAAEAVSGTTNYVAKFTSSMDLGNSILYDAGGRIGLGTEGPLDVMHVRFLNTNGGLTGYAVQNLGNTSTSYSGTLFYDHLGNLGQFQGFNNITHEYRINNIARNASSQFDGSINFMIGSTSRFLVSSGGSIGINVTNPVPVLDISNNNTSLLAANVSSTSYSAGPFASIFLGRKARGTAAAPAAVQNGDNLAVFQGRGYGTTGFGFGGGAMVVRAFENFTDTAQGTALQFQTTRWGTTALNTVMTINPAGDVGIGTTAPSGALEIARSSGDYNVFFTAYAGEASVITRKARGGNPAAPTAALAGDELGGFFMSGYGATGFSSTAGAGMGGVAAENWTDTAQGTALFLATTPLGSNEAQINMVMLPSGNVGIGVPLPPDDFPTVPDRLVVFGDIRVGTSGTNGCVKRFDGNALIGTCASDARFKKNITPFGSALAAVAALRPVHYDWRTSEFPDRHFSANRSYGLIAQEVEQVLPELVVTEADGYKAVDYTKLPLLTIQAVRELKAENDGLKAENAALAARLAELERLMTELMSSRR